MIFDKLDNAKLYKGLSGRLDRALELAANTDFAGLEDGKYEVDGENIFYMVQQYNAKPIAQGRLEGHRSYIDVQIVVEGNEIIGIETLQNQELEADYDAEKDLIFYKSNGSLTKFKISTGHFCVLFPDDLHMPGVTDQSPSQVKKVVIKVKV